MGTLQGNISFTGSLSNLSAYKMRGHDKIILRTKGGANKKRIQKAPEFETTRNLNNEWKMVTKSAMYIRNGLYALKPLADYNISGPLNAMVKKIQTTDIVNPKGKRSILFSLHSDFLSSFNYNRQTFFDTVIRQPITIDINKSTGIADLMIPSLQPAINFFSHPRYAYYRIVMALTAISDYICYEANQHYHSVNPRLPEYKAVYGPWAATSIVQPPAPYQLISNNSFLPGPGMILILGAGIQYGMPSADGSIQPVPYAGAARILKCV